MKTFKLHGNTAYWKVGLAFNVLNLNTLENDATSPIPTDKGLYVSVVSNLYKVKGEEVSQVLKGEISDTDKSALLAEIHANVPDFIISVGGKVVGYANYRNADNSVIVSEKNVDIDKIVGDNLAILVGVGAVYTIQHEGPKVTDEDIVALAELKDNLAPKVERVAIIDHVRHILYIEDIDIQLLTEKYNGEEELYIKDSYTFDGDWSWDFIVDCEYTPNDEDTITFDPADLI